MSRALLPALLAGLALRIVAYAGGGPEGCVVIFNPADVTSVTVAARYQQVRGIPESNMVPYVFPASFTRTTGWDFIYAVRQTLAARGIGRQVQCVAIAGSVPLNSYQTTPTGNVTSTHSFIYLSPNFGQASFPTDVYGDWNTAWSTNSAAFRGPAPAGTRAIAADTPIGGRIFWPVSAPGYPGRGGLSPRETLAFIERSKSHDAAKPDGTIYWPLNSDIRSSTREFEIDRVAEAWRARGIASQIIGDNTTTTAWVANRSDIAGGIVGIANFSIYTGNTILPGVWIDHLTSNGGNWNDFTPPQTTATQWLRAGADGSSGTMSEPYAISSKFPHAHIQTHLRAGASLAEAFWQSIGTCAEILCAGDPLLQPFADFPSVVVTAPAEGATVSGNIAIDVTAAPTSGKTLEPDLDLFVDGRRIGIGDPGEPVLAGRGPGGFVLDTTTISDGWHDLRVVAYNADSVRTQNGARFSVVVNNVGGSLALTGPATVNPDASANFTATNTGLADLVSLALRANGRTLATFPVAGGTVSVDLSAAATLAPFDGDWTLYAVGTRSNGQQVFSAPFTAAISWPAMPANASPSLGGALANVRCFYDTTPTGFSWDTTPPSATATTAGDATYGLHITGSNIAGITITDYAKKPGYQLDWQFYAPVDDWYELGFEVGTEKYSEQRAAFIDGRALVEQNFMFQPRRLAAGWHSVRARMVVNNPGYGSWTLRIRGGASQDFAIVTPALNASAGTGGPADSPTISSVVASPNPATGTTTALAATATIGGGTPPELAGLTYYWTLLGGPEPVTFSANGTNAAKNTAVTFTASGTYSFGLRVSGSNGSAISSCTMSVGRTISPALTLDIGSVLSIYSGDAMNAFAFSKDQFGRRMDVAPTDPALPSVRWSTNDANGTITLLGADGEHAAYRSLASSGTFTLTATGVNGRVGSASKSIPVLANIPPSAVDGILFDITAGDLGEPVTFASAVDDPEGPNGRYTTYLWTVVSTPPGQSLVLSGSTYEIITGMPSGPGTYSIRLEVADQTGQGTAQTRSFVVDSYGAAHAPPWVGTPGAASVLVGDTAEFFAAATNGITLQWQMSADGGTTWQDIPGANSVSLKVGPVVAGDSGKKFRLVGSSAAGTVTGGAATLTVDNPAGGCIGFSVLEPSVIESSGTAQIVVHRAGNATGAVSATVTLYPGIAVLGVDYRGFDGASQTVITLDWPDGDGSDRVLNIPLIDNALQDGQRDCYLIIDGVTGGASLSERYYNYLFIDDDDSPGTVSLADGSAAASESSGQVVLAVRRSDSDRGPLAIGYSTGYDPSASQPAIAGQDYTATSGTLAWADGDSADKQIVVPVTNDGSPEGDETFLVTLDGDPYLLGWPATATVTISDAPYQQWQKAWWPSAFAGTPPAFAHTADAIRGYSPLFLYRFLEVSGTTVAAVDSAGNTVLTGTLGKSGTNVYLLGQPGPRPPAWPGLESANTALAVSASGTSGTPVQFSAGAFAKVGGGYGIASAIKSGFTFGGFVRTGVTDRGMYLLGTTGTNGAQFSVRINTAFNNSTANVPHSLRIYVRSDGSKILDYSVALAGLPSGSLCDGQWHHIAITVPAFTGYSYDLQDNADYPRFFFDGTEVNILDVRGTENILGTDTFAALNDATSTARIAASGAASAGGYFSGSLDELSFIPRELSPDEIARIADAGPLPAPPPESLFGANLAADGLVNGLKYALGLNPLVPGVLPFAESFVQIGADRYMALTYSENIFAADATKTVEVSGDLVHWESGPAFTTLVSSSTTGDLRTVTVRDNAPLSSNPRRFIRVIVTMP